MKGVLAATIMFAAAFTGCSLEVPKAAESGLRILIDPQPEAQFFSSLVSGPSIQAPTSISSFNCFAINVTGSGIPADNTIPDCTSTNNFGGVGVGRIEGLIARNESVSMTVPSGTKRTVDVIGIYPTEGSCNGGDGGGGGGGGGGGSTDLSETGEVYGYIVGRVVTDIIEPKSITIPVSFASGTPISMTCKEFDKLIPVYGTPSQGELYDVGCVAPASVSSTAPGGGTQVTAANTSEATDADSTHYESGCGTSGNQAIMEMRWNVSGRSLGHYDRFTVIWSGRAGYYGAGCSNSPPTGTTIGASPRFQIYNYALSVWEDGDASPGTAVSTYIIERGDSTLGNYISSSGVISARVVGGEISISSCSTVQTDAVQLRLHYSHQ